MAIIDDKVVAMSFENSKFQSGVSQTLSSLDKLKAALHFPGAGKGLQDLDAAGKKVDLNHIGGAVDNIRSKLSLLGVAGAAIFASLALKAVSAATSMAKAFTLGPMKAGFAEYSTNLNAVQTIMANTQAAGIKLKDVNAALLELNEYSDKTIYNFSQMAKNIGTFTAAGVELDTSVAAIKGIANLAALSGSNADQASTAMYQLSQALSSGSVKLMDWNSVVNAGMGGTVFQRALAQTAERMGTLSKGAVTLKGKMKNVTIEGESFRNSLSAPPGKTGWLTSDVLTKTLAQFTGDLKDAELAAMGFNAQQIKDIQATAVTAQKAATMVKTFAQLIDVAKETAGSGWAQTWQHIFGDFEEAKKLWTGVSEAVNGLINASSDARNKILSDWKELGGRTAAIDAIRSAFESLGKILAPIKDAFRQFFPAKTGADLMYFTQQFEALVEKLKPSTKTIFQLRHTFAGLFAVLDIGWEIIKGVVGVFRDLIGASGAGGGSFLSFTNNIGNSLVAFHKWLIEGGRLAAFFDRLGAILAAPIDLLRAIATAVSDLFAGFSPGEFFSGVDQAGQKLSPLQAIMEGIARIWGLFLDVVSGSGKAMRPAVDAIVDAIQSIVPAIGGAASGMNFEAILAVIRTGFLGALVLMFKKFLGKGSILQQLTGRGGFFGNITGIFGTLTGSLKSMQNNLKADTLQKIAIAIALLTVSVVALSFVDPDKLKSALTAMAVAFGQLLIAMAILDKISSAKGFLKMPLITASMILMAGAIDLLTVAVVALSLLSWEDLVKGLGGVAVMLGTLVVAVKPLTASAPGMIKAGLGISAIAAALVMLSIAVRILGTMDLDDLGKGLAGVAAGLVIMVFAMQKMPEVPVKGTLGLVAMAGALLLLATAIRTLGSMDLQSLGKGLGGMAAGLILMVFAMNKMPEKSMLRNSAALILMAGAIRIIANSIVKMGGMSIKQLATGLIALGGSLAIMAGALHLMSSALPGAIALGVASAGIAVLAPALVALGRQSWGQILKSMIALAVALGVLAGAAVLITPAIPSMLGLGVALTLIGAGLALAGVGIAAVAWGLAALVVAAPAGVGILIAAFVSLTKGIIDNIKLLVLGLLEIVEAVAATAPKFVAAGIKILNALLDGLIQVMPKLIVTFQALIDAGLQLLNVNQSKFIQAGMDLLLALLTGIRNNIPKIVTIVADIIVKFLSSLSNNLNRIIAAGVNLLISFLKGIANSHAKIVTAVVGIVTKFLSSIANNLGKIITAGVSILVKLLEGIAKNIKNVITAAGNIIINFITGIGKKAKDIIAAGAKVIIEFVQGLGQKAVEIANAAGQAIVDFLVGLRVAVDTYAPQIRTESARLGVAIIKGMLGGLAGAAGDLYNKAKEIAGKALSILKKPWSALSPSRTMFELGTNIIQGMTKGLDATAPQVYASAAAVSNGLIDKFKNTFQITSPSKVMYNIGKAVGEGFAQGIRGSADDIKNAFTELNSKLLDEMRTARETIAAEEDRLAAMLKEKAEKIKEINSETFKKEGDKAKALAKVQKQYAEPIAEAQKAIAQNQELLKKSTAAHIVLIKNLKDEKKELIGLADEFDKLTEELDAAVSKLEELVSARKSALEGYESQYSDLPDISGPMTAELAEAKDKIAEEKAKLAEVLAAKIVDPKAIESANAAIVAAQAKFDELIANKVLNAEGTEVDPVATYLLALKNQALAVDTYAATLEQLRKLGLDHETYKMLVDGGTADQDFATALLAGGQTAITGLNKLDLDLKTASKKLATQAASYLHDAGIKAQEGLIEGLKANRGKLRKEMEAIARVMIRALKKELGIKSPSEEFAKLGTYAMEGMAKGFTDSSKKVTNAVDAAAQDALAAMRRSMRDISTAVSEELITDPVITPILDLTLIRSQAQELAALTAAESFGQASAISSAQIAAEAEETLAATAGSSITFEQNNYSPKALTDIEIYRNTRNQLSQLKSVLAT